MKKRFLGIFALAAILTYATVMISEERYKRFQNQLVIPSLSEVKENGYPVNENNETYGGDIKESDDIGPDLILVENSDGLAGYIRRVEIDKLQPETLEQAAVYQPKSFQVDMYLQDGKTKIGIYTIGE